MTQLFLNFTLVWFSFLMMVSFSPKVNAFPQDQFKDCILASKSNPAVIGVPETAIEAFCNCALTAIVDEGKNDQNSAIECAEKELNN
ncbi:Predicted protein [Prochlorococcus marinus subsp. marinus str. CCMP1375]|uniref:Uncharacterized protein n=2 Tax=Prochlorococcaceae TaxID=2881426 RepID=Q7VB91_PROMA|nr:Predicted protein [Prochlorococcus marinus subsp. marinus str. CCMP1375]